MCHRFDMVRGAFTEAPQNEWEKWAMMRHHGMPTRLLDWTSSAAIAMYFAVKFEPPREKPVVWALNASSLNREIIALGESGGKGEMQHYLPSKIGTPGYKLPAKPIWLSVSRSILNRRMVVQHGSFTTHGSEAKPLEALASDALCKIEVKKDSLGTLNRDLRDLGITHSVVFPELDFLCREISEQYLQ